MSGFEIASLMVAAPFSLIGVLVLVLAVKEAHKIYGRRTA